MAMNVPFPFRVAAGAIAVGLDRLRTLPTELPAMSVSLAGHAVRASMRVQQELAHLAARGEEVLAPLTDRPEEHPAWARFDDDDVVDGVVVDDAAGDGPADAGVDAETGVDADADAGEDPAAGPDAAPAAVLTAHEEADRAAADTAAVIPGALPGYDQMSVAQLRVRLRDLDETAVVALLDYERSGLARAAFVTTLQNRLTSLRSDKGAAPNATARGGRGKRA